MRKLLIYPFNLESLPIVRYHKDFIGYSEIIPVIEKGIAIMESIDVGYLDNGTSCGVVTTSDFEKSLSVADDVLFLEGASGESKEAFQEKILLAKKMNKNIYCFPPETQYASNTVADETKVSLLSKINAPVIMVIGQGQQCNKFEIQLGLRKRFLEMGYKVSQVGTKGYSPLLGFHAIPHFPKAPLTDKIYSYNHYFAEIVDKENPDVLIVGVPGGIMPIDERHNEMFGETAIAISKSIRPDITILSQYLMEMYDEYIEAIEGYAKYALGASLDYLHISNTKLIFEQDMRNISYLSTDYARVFDGQDELDDRFFNVFLDDTFETVFNNILAELQDNLMVI